MHVCGPRAPASLGSVQGVLSSRNGSRRSVHCEHLGRRLLERRALYVTPCIFHTDSAGLCFSDVESTPARRGGAESRIKGMPGLALSPVDALQLQAARSGCRISSSQQLRLACRATDHLHALSPLGSQHPSPVASCHRRPRNLFCVDLSTCMFPACLSRPPATSPRPVRAAPSPLQLSAGAPSVQRARRTRFKHAQRASDVCARGSDPLVVGSGPEVHLSVLDFLALSRRDPRGAAFTGAPSLSIDNSDIPCLMSSTSAGVMLFSSGDTPAVRQQSAACNAAGCQGQQDAIKNPRCELAPPGRTPAVLRRLSNLDGTCHRGHWARRPGHGWRRLHGPHAPSRHQQSPCRTESSCCSIVHPSTLRRKADNSDACLQAHDGH